MAFRGILRVLMASALVGGLSASAAEPGELPRTMAWTAYNLGTTGYNQSVGIGQMLRQRYNVTLRVIPGNNDISRLIPLRRGMAQFSASGVASYFAQEGVFQFAHPDWGPLPLRLLASSNGDSNQALAVAADTGITEFSELRGKRIPWVRGAPALNVSTEAFLACGGLGWNDVQRVEFPGYSAMWNGIQNNQIDAAFATTVSGPTRQLEASPRGISWPTVAHDDEACWARLTRIAPYFTPHVATRGAGISDEAPHEGATYPYPLLITLADQHAGVVRALVAAIDTHFEDFRHADPGAVGWARDRQQFDWVVPYHAGAIAHWRSVGAWTAAHDTHNDALIRRQEVLAEAWAAVTERGIRNADAFRDAWLELRAERLEAAGFDPVWHRPID